MAAKAKAAAADGATVALPAGVFALQGESKGGKVRYYGTSEDGSVSVSIYASGKVARETVAAAVAFSGRAITVTRKGEHDAAVPAVPAV